MSRSRQETPFRSVPRWLRIELAQLLDPSTLVTKNDVFALAEALGFKPERANWIQHLRPATGYTSNSLMLFDLYSDENNGTVEGMMQAMSQIGRLDTLQLLQNHYPNIVVNTEEDDSMSTEHSGDPQQNTEPSSGGSHSAMDWSEVQSPVVDSSSNYFPAHDVSWLPKPKHLPHTKMGVGNTNGYRQGHNARVSDRDYFMDQLNQNDGRGSNSPDSMSSMTVERDPRFMTIDKYYNEEDDMEMTILNNNNGPYIRSYPVPFEDGYMRGAPEFQMTSLMAEESSQKVPEMRPHSSFVIGAYEEVSTSSECESGTDERGKNSTCIIKQGNYNDCHVPVCARNSGSPASVARHASGAPSGGGMQKQNNLHSRNGLTPGGKDRINPGMNSCTRNDCGTDMPLDLSFHRQSPVTLNGFRIPQNARWWWNGSAKDIMWNGEPTQHRKHNSAPETDVRLRHHFNRESVRNNRVYQSCPPEIQHSQKRQRGAQSDVNGVSSNSLGGSHSISVPPNNKPGVFGKGSKEVRVFITYSMHSDRHVKRVLDLAKCLRQNGFSPTIDMEERLLMGQDVLGWLDQRFKEADFVLVCISPKYKLDTDAVNGMSEKEWHHEMDHSIHTRYIFKLMQNEYTVVKKCRNLRFVPVIFPEAGREHVPGWLQGTFVYQWPTQYRDLFFRLLRPERLLDKGGQCDSTSSESEAGSPTTLVRSDSLGSTGSGSSVVVMKKA